MAENGAARGPLEGIRVVEVGGIGPAPFCGMVLSGLGAEVVKVGRPTPVAPLDPVLDRGKRSVLLDLQDERARTAARRLMLSADVVIEGFRPGVMERLGLGPEDLTAERTELVYGRVTGFGQEGPMAAKAGHDINYIAMTGALASIGRAGGQPVPPLNLVADFGGGGMLLVVGVLAALWQRTRSGRGDVVDAAMVDGVGLLMAMQLAMFGSGAWSLERGTNVLDSGAPFYDAYRTQDGKYVAVGAVEPVFYRRLVETLGLLDRVVLEDQRRQETWPHTKALFAEAFESADLATWLERFADVDACVTPVLDMSQLAADEHHRARESFRVIDSTIHPSPAPRFRSAGERPPAAPEAPGGSTARVLADLGIDIAGWD